MRIAALAAAGFVTTLVATLVPIPDTVPAADAKTSAPPLTVSVVRISPSWTPAPTKTETPLSITVQLQNTTSSDVRHVALSAGRGSPIFGARGDTVSVQSKLNSSLADDKLPAGLLPIPARPAVQTGVDVPAHGITRTTFTTTTTTSTPYRGLCLCANAVYPIYLSAIETQSGAVEGFARTYLSSVDGAADQVNHKDNAYRKLGVAWVWPLIDAPHRLADGRVFTDRTLVARIGPEGRLGKALQVAQDVGSYTPMTIVLDPDLVDEIGLLAGGDYFYLSSSGRKIPGAAVPAAQAWLTRLRAVLAYRDVSVEFTPYADPDIQSLSANDLHWNTRLPPTMLGRIQRALGRTTIPGDLSWPPNGAVGTKTLSRIAQAGATSVLLDDSSVRPTNLDGLPLSSATLHTSHGTLAAALTSPAMQDDVAASVRANDGSTSSRLPALLAELAVRTDQDPYTRRTAFLTPPRYANVNVIAADTVIRETTSSPFSAPISVDAALRERPTSGSVDARLRHRSFSKPNPTILATAQQLSRSLPALHAMLTGTGESSGAQPLLTDLSRGLQRTESAAFLSTSSRSSAAIGARLADRLRRQVSTVLTEVHIVRPEPGKGAYNYTLASTNSPLPITIDNSSQYRAFVHITVATTGGLPGLTATDLDESIAPDSKQTFRVPAHVQRSGRIALTATLTTAGGDYVLGSRVQLSVHSTVFGTVGVVITVVAALVLLLALLLRYIRRIQRLRRKRRASSGDRPVPARVHS